MKAYKITAICIKQLKDILKNKEVLIQFMVFPIIAAILKSAVKIEGMEANYFVTIFAAMYVGMAPLIVMATILSEEKEKSTYRILCMSNVKPIEFLMGVGVSILAACTLGALAFGLIGGYEGAALVRYVGIMILGILVAMLLGSAIGLGSKNQMAAASIAIPAMMVFSFLPMLGSFNAAIGKVSRFTFSQGVCDLLADVENMDRVGKPLAVIGVNFLVAAVLFIMISRLGMRSRDAG